MRDQHRRFKKTGKLNTPPKKLLGRTFNLTFGVPAFIFDSYTDQIAAVPPALGDEVTIASWLATRRAFVQLTLSVVRSARHRKVFQILPKILSATQTRHQGDQLIASFGFQYCGTSQDR